MGNKKSKTFSTELTPKRVSYTIRLFIIYVPSFYRNRSASNEYELLGTR